MSNDQTHPPQPSLIALSACPWCNANVTLAYSGQPATTFYVACTGCKATGPERHSFEAATEAWNTRPQSRPEAELPEVTDEMVTRAGIAFNEVCQLEWTDESIRAALQAAYGQQCAATRPAKVGGDLELADARRAFWLVVAAAGGSKGVSVPRNIVEDYDERTASIRFVETHGGYTWFAETSIPSAPGSEVKS